MGLSSAFNARLPILLLYHLHHSCGMDFGIPAAACTGECAMGV
jgi:hypothetical protein